MSDLATLGLRIESQQADQAAARMDKMAGAAANAERAIDALGMGSTKANSAIASMLASIDRTTKEMLEVVRLHNQAAGAANTQAAATQSLTNELNQASMAGVRFYSSFKATQTAMGGSAAGIDDFARAVGNGTRKIGENDAHMVAYRAHLKGVSRESAAATRDGLNLSRQFADIGVTAAMGMNPLMIAIQQGPQLLDIFQEKAIRTNTTIKAAAADSARGIAASFAPFLPLIATITAVGATAYAGWGLAARAVTAEIGDLTKEMGLSADQLKRLKDDNVNMTATAGDAWRGLGTTIKDAFLSVFGDELKWVSNQWNALMDYLTFRTGAGVDGILGLFVGAYAATSAVWARLPVMMADATVTAANAAIRAIEFMINKGKDGINALLAGLRELSRVNPAFAWANAVGNIGDVSLGQIANPASGVMGGGLADAQAAYAEGFGSMQGTSGRFMDIWRDNTEASGQARIRKDAGDPKAERAGRTGKTDAERDYERLIKAGEDYRDGLIEERAVLGMTALERKAYEAQAQADILIKEGQTDAAKALAAEILKEAAALRDATIADDARQSQKRAGDEMEMLRLERDLIGATNVVRARQIAMLTEEIRLRNLYGKDFINTAQAQGMIGSAGDVAGYAEGNRQAQDRYNDSLTLSLDLARQFDDQMRSVGDGMAESFGRVGEVMGNALSIMSGFQVQMAEIDEQERKYRDTLGEGAELNERLAMLARDRGAAETQAYADALLTAKNFFDEGSTGYRALQAAEAAWRVFQFAMSVQAMVQDAAETTSSVANSTVRGAASAGAGAAKMFEQLGPYAFPVVAAMLALLASLGMRGKGGGATASSDVSASVESVQAGNAQQEQARSSFAATVAQKVEVRVTADREGMNAYVAQTAREEAVPVVARGVMAGAQATKSDIMGTMKRQQEFGRGQ